MKFSLRTLLIGFTLVSVSLGSFTAYRHLWVRHCESLEPSLYRFIIANQIEECGTIKSFAFGHPADTEWTQPTAKMMAKINLNGIDAVQVLSNKDAVCFVQNVRWIDWNTVSIDFGTCQSNLESEGYEGATCSFTGGEWAIQDFDTVWSAGGVACH